MAKAASVSAYVSQVRFTASAVDGPLSGVESRELSDRSESTRTGEPQGQRSFDRSNLPAAALWTGRDLLVPATSYRWRTSGLNNVLALQVAIE